MINVLIIIFILIVVLIKSRQKDLKFKNKKIKYVSLFLHASIIVYIFLIFFRLLGNGISKFYDTYFELAIVSLYIFLLVEQIGVEKNIEEIEFYFYLAVKAALFPVITVKKINFLPARLLMKILRTKRNTKQAVPA